MVKLKLIVKDLDLLEETCNELGYKFHRGKTKARYYGGSTIDCDHVIEVPGTNHEIAVIDNRDGSYTLKGDFYGSEGKVLKEAYEKIEQLYTVKAVKREAYMKGYSVFEEWVDENICKLKISV